MLPPAATTPIYTLAQPPGWGGQGCRLAVSSALLENPLREGVGEGAGLHNPLVTWQRGWAQGLSGFGDPQGWGGGAGPEEWRWEKHWVWRDPEKVKESGVLWSGCVWGGGSLDRGAGGSGFLGGTQRPTTGESTGVSEAGEQGSLRKKPSPEAGGDPKVETLWVCDLRGGSPGRSGEQEPPAGGCPRPGGSRSAPGGRGPQRLCWLGPGGSAQEGRGDPIRPRGLAREGEGASGGLLGVGASHSVKRGHLGQGS